ncbi:uncharacterized protein BCR38DRAFT_44551 [Pseudomassariella vexata]|uniref:Uncharacterized protein n=1 Tax=Pseudomassariella vexata TaxID=1141098 RepID=A0A1Y2DN46_9PEZI|nr:uncharacterized protein BCR38DRAFT_44551 [Pseudomassariella vexata]ORY60681.1 hypothetical protein BCR38DRAFT_44551 [Pseudomassariella vexata]
MELGKRNYLDQLTPNAGSCIQQPIFDLRLTHVLGLLVIFHLIHPTGLIKLGTLHGGRMVQALFDEVYFVFGETCTMCILSPSEDGWLDELTSPEKPLRGHHTPKYTPGNHLCFSFLRAVLNPDLRTLTQLCERGPALLQGKSLVCVRDLGCNISIG